MITMWARSLAWIGRRTSNPKTPGSNPGGSALINIYTIF